MYRKVNLRINTSLHFIRLKLVTRIFGYFISDRDFWILFRDLITLFAETSQDDMWLLDPDDWLEISFPGFVYYAQGLNYQACVTLNPNLNMACLQKRIHSNGRWKYGSTIKKGRKKAFPERIGDGRRARMAWVVASFASARSGWNSQLIPRLPNLIRIPGCKGDSTLSRSMVPGGFRSVPGYEIDRSRGFHHR